MVLNDECLPGRKRSGCGGMGVWQEWREVSVWQGWRGMGLWGLINGCMCERSGEIRVCGRSKKGWMCGRDGKA